MNEPCPDDAVLDAFVRGALTPDAIGSLETHVDRCDSCGELIATLARSHTRRAPRESQPALEPGAIVGKYTLRATLGEGASGRVFVAWDPSVSREVALKVLRPERAMDAIARERLVREAAALAKLSHPNVVTVFDAGEADDTVFVAMEIVRGPSLRAFAQDATRSSAEVLAVLRAIGEGLATAHARGLLHRDIKPDNIIVGDDRPRLVDFGLAAHDRDERATHEPVATHLTQTGALLGTPLYMAPETLDGAPATERSDLYSLAVTAYESLARRRPFDATSLPALRAQIARGAEPIPAIAPALDRAIRAALAESPADRPASVRAWLASLEPAPPRARPRGPTTALAALGLAAITLVGASAVIRRAATTPPNALVAQCPAGDEPLAPLRDSALQSRIRAAMTRGHPSAGARGSDALFAAIDRFAQRWTAAHRAACPPATTPSPDRWPASRGCLLEARDEALGVLRSFERADRDSALRATAVEQDLPSVDRCADGRALLARAPQPNSAAIDEARSLIAQAMGAVTQGHLESAQALAERAVRVASGAGWGPIEARARRLLARTHRARGAFDDAEREARRSALLAESSRDDDGAARAWIERVRAMGAQGDWAETLRAIEQAEASVTRVGDRSLSASLELLRAMAASNLGRLDDAERALDRAMQQTMEQGMDRSPVLSAQANVARQRGRFEQSLRLHREALALDRARLGDDHPVLAAHAHNIAGVLRRLGRDAEAKAQYEQALAIERRWLGDRSLEAGLTKNSLGLLALETAQLDEAERWLTEARSILEGRSEASLAALNLALLAIARGRFEQAQTLAAWVEARDRLALGPVHVRVARAAKVSALASVRSRAPTSAATAMAALDRAEQALQGLSDAEATLVRDECALLRASLEQRTRTPSRSTAERPSQSPRSSGDQRTPTSAPTSAPPPLPGPQIEPPAPRVAAPTVAPTTAPLRAAPSGSGSYGPAQRWGP